jgi:ketosteroid isomerase-like protein
MFRMLPTLLLLVSPVLAEKEAQPVKPSDVPPAAAPAIAKEALAGSWHLDMEVGGVRVKGVTEYQDGGTFQSRATFVVEDETIELSLKGAWKLDGSILTTTITESSDPEFATVGEVSKDEILELTATTLRYRDEDGLVVRETRADPAGEPPAKVPGKPVPPEEVKAIHAAIDAMERSFREGDLMGIVKGTYPGLIVQAGGEAKFRESLERAVALLKSGEIKISDVQLDAPAELHEAGEERVCFVPKRSTIEADGRRVRSQGFYVAVRKKTENEWKLLDGAGFRGNPEMLWTLLPELPRGVAIPAVEREVVEE